MRKALPLFAAILGLTICVNSPAGWAGQPTASNLAREGYTLSPKDAENIEIQLTKNSNDLDSRTRLLGYYFARSSQSSEHKEIIEARRRHILWIIQNNPEADIAGMPEVSIDPSGHGLADPAGYEQAKVLWIEQGKAQKSNATVVAHAVKFLQLHNKELAESILKNAQEIDPKNPQWSMQIGHLYALGIMGINGLNQNGLPTSVDPLEVTGNFARRARESLKRSSDTTLTATASALLVQYGAILNGMGLSKENYGALAEEIMTRSGAATNPWVMSEHYHLERLRARSIKAKKEFAQKELEQLEKMIPVAPDDESRSMLLASAAKAAFEGGALIKAQTHANTLLKIASKHVDEISYGPAIHDSNMILGRLALQAGDKQSAKAYLINAGRTLGGGTLTSFGPNMSLAKDLLESGERDTVIKYLELCQKFWGYQKNPLASWVQKIKAGKLPEFGPNLNY